MKYFALVGCLMLASGAVAGGKTPVMVGGNDGLDACMAMGSVVTDSRSKRLAAVYPSPIQGGAVLENVPEGTLVMVCDESKNDWIGIVYSRHGESYCGLTTSIEPRQPYKGECRSGWIRKSNIEIVAG